MKDEILVAAENSGISRRQLKVFMSNLKNSEIFLISKDNIIVLNGDGTSTDQVEFICMNGKMVQINLTD